MRTLLVLLVIGSASSARAAVRESFAGFSADGSFYGIAADAGGIATSFRLCLLDGATAPATWPKDVKAPAPGACTETCADEDGDVDAERCANSAENYGKLLVLPKTASRGPHGETAVFEAKNGLTVTLTAPGKPPVVRTMPAPEGLEKGSKIANAWWRADGGAVALDLERPPSHEFDDMIPAFVVVVPFAAVLGHDRAAAQAANARGMAAYKKKDWAGAMAEFRAAIAEDDSHVLARYNLACTASLAGDVETALVQLQWLAKPADADAKRRIEKAKTDPDLAPIRSDPRVKELLGL